MNARVKLVFTLVFIFCINLTPSGSWPSYVLFFTMLIVELILSGISVKKVLLRSLISLPFVLSAIPLLFIGHDPRTPLFSIGTLSVSISEPGLIRFFTIVIKSWISILAAILLTSTTKFDEILSAFRQVGIPKLFVAIISLMWRYLALMVGDAQSLMRARDSRSGTSRMNSKTGGTLAWRASVTGKMAGNLLLRSIERSDRVYAAMLSRGYNGDVHKEQNHSISKRECLVISTSSLLSILILAFSVFFK